MAALPKPNRSNFQPKLLIDEETGEMDLGWAEGEFSDGRPYRAELWSWVHLSAITFIFSADGLENATEKELADLLGKEVPLNFKESKSISAAKMKDSSGIEMWAVSVIVRHEEEKLVTAGIQFHPYQELSPVEKGRRVLPYISSRHKSFRF